MLLQRHFKHEINFPYPDIEGPDIPDGKLKGVYEPEPPTDEGGLSTQSLMEALRDPVNCAPLSQEIDSNDEVLILVDDYTRPTPVSELLPALLLEIRSAEVDQSQVRIMVASGTHKNHNHCTTGFNSDF